MDIGEFLSVKRMGMPTWVWATGGVAVLAFGVMYYRQKKAGATTATATDTPDGAGADDASSAPTSQAAFPMPYSGGDVFVNVPSQPQTPVATNSGIPAAYANRAMGSYVVKGTAAYNAASSLGVKNPVTDQYPGGVAAIVYGLAGNKNNPDILNIAADVPEIVLVNPTKIPPYPIGTTLSYVLHPERLAPVTTAATQTTTTTNAGTTGTV